MNCITGKIVNRHFISTLDYRFNSVHSKLKTAQVVDLFIVTDLMSNKSLMEFELDFFPELNPVKTKVR